MATIVYAEDEKRYWRLVELFLKAEGHTLRCFPDGRQALDHILSHRDVDLAIVDLMMPEMDGRELCARIRERSELPVIMLTALGEEEDEVAGLELGADDYLSKPFSRARLVARVQRLLQRAGARSRQNGEELQVLGFAFDPVHRRVSFDGRSVDLSPREYDLLSYLIDHRGQVLSRQQILDGVWGSSYFGDPRTVDTHVKSLRSSLDHRGTQIVTVRGVGYSFQETP